MKETIKKFGKIDILINNSAIAKKIDTTQKTNEIITKTDTSTLSSATDNLNSLTYG
jgi:hypothetical protein